MFYVVNFLNLAVKSIIFPQFCPGAFSQNCRKFCPGAFSQNGWKKPWKNTMKNSCLQISTFIGLYFPHLSRRRGEDIVLCLTWHQKQSDTTRWFTDMHFEDRTPTKLQTVHRQTVFRCLWARATKSTCLLVCLYACLSVRHKPTLQFA